MAFEPIPELYTRLLKKFPTVEVYNHALSDVNGEVEFNYVVNAPGYSGLKQRDYDGLKPEIREIKVHADTLDNIYPSERKLYFIKLDVEGAEYKVLKGSINTITTNKPKIVYSNLGREQLNTMELRRKIFTD